MSTYIHPDGTHVGTTDTPGEIATWHASADGPGDRQYIHPARAAAIHAAYLDSLGLWLDEETGCLVDTASRHTGPYETPSYSVLRREPGGHLAVDEGWAGQCVPIERDLAVDRYVATLTPPQPEPQPGEVWEVLDDAPMRVHVSAGRQLHQIGTGVWCSPDLPRRRLMTADGEWVGGES